MKRNYCLGAAFLALLIALGAGSSLLQKRATVEAAGVQVPRFEVDPMWPKPLPNHWVMGSVIGVAADASDHIWIIHRQGSLEPKEMSAASKPPGAECCSPAPPVLEFNEAGDLIGHWGGPGQGYDWPSSNHGITVDYKGNVWIGGNGRGQQPAALAAYNPNDPPPQQFRNPVHCVELASDGLLYVCDRTNDRIQVFKKDGAFVKEAFIAKNTLVDGSVFDIALSKDPQQKYLYVADGSNMKIHIVQRDTLEVLTSFGDGGRQPGEFYGVHSIATDSKGNIFTTETYRGQRMQKFHYRGLGPVTKKDQGVVWPKSKS